MTEEERIPRFPEDLVDEKFYQYCGADVWEVGFFDNMKAMGDDFRIGKVYCEAEGCGQFLGYSYSVSEPTDETAEPEPEPEPVHVNQMVMPIVTDPYSAMPVGSTVDVQTPRGITTLQRATQFQWIVVKATAAAGGMI